MPRLTPGCQAMSLGLWVGTSPPCLAAQGEGRSSRSFHAHQGHECLPGAAGMLAAQGQRGAAPGGFACRARASWKFSPGALFSSDLCWHALAAGGIRRLTRVREHGRGSQPFQQIERELMRGWHAFSICERSREQGDSAWLQPEKDPKSLSSEGPFLLIFFGKFKKE